MPVTLSRALRIVEDITTTGKRRPHWFRVPVETLIDYVGDVRACDVTPEQVIAWHASLRDAPNRYKPGQRLSPWTVDSYGRAVKSFFNHLVKAGHIDASPARRLLLPRLPAKGKKDIDDGDIDRLIAVADLGGPRDLAIVLTLRDAGCRVGELVSMTAHGVRISENGGEMRGRAIVESEKTHAARYVYLGDEACQALRRYLRARGPNVPDALWLSRAGTPLTGSGVYLLLKRLGKRAGVQQFSAHAFRHALARRLVLNGAPPKAVQEILGHADVSTTLNMYVRLEPDDLERFHRQYNTSRRQDSSE
jgi:integrase/recombinase XerD